MADAVQETPARLPRREQFLSTGVTPVTGSFECGICLEEPALDPVRLPCHHTHLFCRACITRWLEEADDCPNCKAKMYRKRSHKEQIVERASQLLRNHGDIQDIATFGSGVFQNNPEDLEMLRRSNRTAGWWLSRGHHAPGQVNVHNQIQFTTGTGFVNAERLRPDFAMLGNYIPAVSEVRNRPYTPQQMEHWNLVLTTLWNILKGYDGRSLDVSSSDLLKKLRKKLKRVPDFDQIQCISRYPQSMQSFRLNGDLMCLIDYVAYLAKQEKRRRRREAQQQPEQHPRWNRFKQNFWRMGRFAWL